MRGQSTTILPIIVAVLTETKLINDKHTAFRDGYSVCASRARSSSQGGVALIFNRSDPRFDMTLFRCWGPDVVSIRMTSGLKTWLIVGVYIPPTFKKDIYNATIEDLLKAAAQAQAMGDELVVLGDINVDLRRITNARLEVLQGNFDGQDDRRAATVSALSSLGLEDIGIRYLQRQRTGIWTWSQVRQGQWVRSVCDYILASPSLRVRCHRIRQVTRCSTDHRMVYVDIAAGRQKDERKRRWGLQRWPIRQSTSSELDVTFADLRRAVPPAEKRRTKHDDWISQRTWDLFTEKGALRWQRQDGADAKAHYKAVKRRATKSLQQDRNDRIENLLQKAEATIQSDPKRSFQLLASWYKRRTGVNLPLARCELDALETEYSELYRAVPSTGEPLRGQVGTGFSIPDEIPEEEEIRKALGRMR